MSQMKDKQKGFLIPNSILVLLVCAAALATAGIFYALDLPAKHLISTSFLALLAGLLFECRRVCNTWSSLLPIIGWSYLWSYIAFLPGKREKVYMIERHIEAWPYTFLFMFILIYIINFKDQVTFKLSEGFTLLQTVAVVYCCVEWGIIGTENGWLQAILIVGLLFSLYSAFHAFSYTQLTHTHRLWLSVWSSIIMLIFAVENIYITFHLENSNQPTGIMYIVFQYFLLGVCSVYMAQNLFMLLQFLPGKGQFFNAAYFNTLRELKEDHIERYSDQQVRILHAIAVVGFVTADFYINHYYDLLPRHLVIWLTFLIYPILFRWKISPRHISIS